MAVYRTVIRRQQDRNSSPFGFAQRVEQRRGSEPRPRQVPERRSVLGHLKENGMFAAAVRELIDEVEHQRGDTTSGQVCRQPFEHLGSFARGGQLLVVHGHLGAGEILELFSQQLVLVGVQALLVLVRPPVGIPLGDLDREQPTEDRVSGERRRRGHDAEVVGNLDVEELGYQRFEQLPLIQAETVDHHKQRLSLGFEQRNEKLLSHIHGKGRSVGLGVRQPPRIVGFDELREVVVQASLQRAQGLTQSRLVARGQPNLPLGQLRDELDPLPPSHLRGTSLLQFTEALHEVLGDALASNLGTFEQTRDGAQHLAGIHRLDEVVVHLHANRFPHRARLFTLGDHHERNGLVDGANLRHEFQATFAGKLLIEQDHAVGAALQQGDGIVPVCRTLHLVPLLLEEEYVRGEGFDLVVHPENRLWTSHGAKLTRGVPPTATWPVTFLAHGE
jgi:hypothetical protein